jgi:hypothetical protein
MSDFLARLAGRALGIAPMVKPVIDPAFAASPSAGVRDDSIAFATDADPGIVGRIVTTPAIERLTQDGVQLQGEVRERIEPHPSKRESTAAHSSTASIDTTAALHDIVVDRAALPLEGAIAAKDRADGIPSRVPADSTVRDSLPEPGEKASYGLIAAPRPSAQRSRPRSHPQAVAAAETPPIVRVTIGRIDVRAEVTSPPPARAAARKPENHGLSLDDYLKQRAEGRR